MWHSTLTIRTIVSRIFLQVQGCDASYVSRRFWTSSSKSASPHYSSHQPWSKEEDEKLMQLRAAGVLLKDAVAMFEGRSLNAVSKRSRALRSLHSNERVKGTPPVPFSQAEDDTITRLRAAGKSWKDVCAALPKRSHEIVARRGRMLARGISTWQKRTAIHSWTPGDKRLLQQLREEEGLSWSKIAEHFPRASKPAMQTTYHRMRIEQGTNVPRATRQWTAEEDKIAERARKEGMPWSMISSALLPHRTPEGIRFRWQRSLNP